MAASVKVYVFAVRSLHIELCSPDPLNDCLRLAQIMRGIKRCAGSSQDQRLPIIPDLVHLIYAKLDFSIYDDIMFQLSLVSFVYVNLLSHQL